MLWLDKVVVLTLQGEVVMPFLAEWRGFALLQWWSCGPVLTCCDPLLQYGEFVTVSLLVVCGFDTVLEKAL
jgi:hypothetical protein